MLRASALIGAILLGASSASTAANGGDVPPCGPRAQLVQAMKQVFDERPRATGLMSSNELFELFVSPEGTWTILVTSPRGISCIAAAGEHWERVPGQVAGRALGR